MIAGFPPKGRVLLVSATDITNAYATAADSAALNMGRAARCRFYVRVVLHASSGLSTVTYKLQQRYTDKDGSLGWIDLPSEKGDASRTLEVDHALTVTAGQTTDGAFYVDPLCIPDIRVRVKGNTTGHVGDSVSVYAAC